MKNRTIGGILLVFGTTVGAGMLALPVITGSAGFIWSAALFLGYWLFSLLTALLILEVNLWFPGNVNLITMARKTLGRGGEVGAWIVYLLLLYALTAAYLAGSGPLLNEGIEALTWGKLDAWAEPILLVIIFAIFVYHGTRWVDYINRFLMAGLVVAYFALIGVALPHIKVPLLSHQEPSALWWTLPVIATSFGFHIIIPSLKIYLKEDVKALRHVIIWGSLLALVVYLLWEGATLGVIPVEGSPSLTNSLALGESATIPLSTYLNNPIINVIASFFAFFAIVTSFLGVALSLTDFLIDGMKIKETQKGRILTTCLTFLPPLIFVWIYPRGFILALEYAGVFVAILLGIYPILMTWIGRRKYGEEAVYRVKAGPALFSAGLVLYITVIVIAIVKPL